MDLMDLLQATGGGDSVGELASADGLGPLGDLISGLGGSSKTGLDDILGLARKFF